MAGCFDVMPLRLAAAPRLALTFFKKRSSNWGWLFVTWSGRGSRRAPGLLDLSEFNVASFPSAIGSPSKGDRPTKLSRLCGVVDTWMLLHPRLPPDSQAKGRPNHEHRPENDSPIKRTSLPGAGRSSWISSRRPLSKCGNQFRSEGSQATVRSC